MAKSQNLPLSPSEISGQCGRLLCCLGYEEDLYRAVKKELPKEGRTVETELQPAKVLRVDVLSEQAQVRFDDGTLMSLTAAQLRGEKPIGRPTASLARSSARRSNRFWAGRGRSKRRRWRPTPSSPRKVQEILPKRVRRACPVAARDGESPAPARPGRARPLIRTGRPLGSSPVDGQSAGPVAHRASLSARTALLAGSLSLRGQLAEGGL